MSIALRKNPNLELPISRPYMDNDLVDNAIWEPYPRLNQTKDDQKPALLRSVGIEMASLAEIAVDILELSFRRISGMGIDGLWNATNELYVRLISWHDNLPEVLQIDDYSVPQVMFLQ